MSYLPPVGWAEVATKQDLAVVRAELGGETAGLRIDMEQRVSRQLRWRVGTMITALGAILAAATTTVVTIVT
jgi:hypothetical protein